MKKKVVAVILTAALAAGVLSACGSTQESGAQEGAAAETESAAQEETPAETESAAQEETASETESVEAKGTITVAATSVPHAEILEAAKPILAQQGWDLQVTEFQDYVQPNEVVEAGDFDANYFQHTPYLNSFNEEKGTHLVSVGEIHYEPLGIYSGTGADLANIEDGAEVAIPNDTTNEARALLLLQDNGLITLKEGAGIEATVNDIAENPHNIKFNELEAAQVSRVLPEVAFVVLNGNYALEAGLNAQDDALAIETSDSEAAKTYVNVIVVKEGNEENEGVKALVDVLKSDEIKQFINDTYQGSVVPFEG
ncbi:MAG: metal ABC transporter substrate-binding protein [Lachnospiraceae bacterium]|nr:metal ABC transporter substrate-binding protein [Lachnospiraceae bacterium]